MDKETKMIERAKLKKGNRPQYKIEDLVKGMNSKNHHDVLEWYEPPKGSKPQLKSEPV